MKDVVADFFTDINTIHVIFNNVDAEIQYLNCNVRNMLLLIMFFGCLFFLPFHCHNHTDELKFAIHGFK